MVSSHGYALKLETVFRRGDHRTVTADDFQHNFKKALEDGLLLLITENLITVSEMNAWMEEYNFADKSLNTILADSTNKERIEELLRRMYHLTKEGEKNNE